jgi:hypothetical protein
VLSERYVLSYNSAVSPDGMYVQLIHVDWSLFTITIQWYTVLCYTGYGGIIPCKGIVLFMLLFRTGVRLFRKGFEPCITHAYQKTKRHKFALYVRYDSHCYYTFCVLTPPMYFPIYRFAVVRLLTPSGRDAVTIKAQEYRMYGIR